jgi:hypothetical protein
MANVWLALLVGSLAKAGWESIIRPAPMRQWTTWKGFVKFIVCSPLF